MQTRTAQHLATADRNYDLAWDLLQNTDIHPQPIEWAVVVGFYAAVHYVNAFIWEHLGYEPRDHRDRLNWVNRIADLRPIAGSYNSLFDYSLKARYVPGFSLSYANGLNVLQHNLANIQNMILSAL